MRLTVVEVARAREVSLLRLVSLRDLSPHGSSMCGPCPFCHQRAERGPFHVNAPRGFFHCFACKSAGSSIDFVMRSQGKDFGEAVRWLLSRIEVPS